MAVLLLTATASALTAGASAFVQIAAAATAVGSFIANRLFGPSMGNTTQEGSRLDSLQVQASTEGAAIPGIAGRVRHRGPDHLSDQVQGSGDHDHAALRRREGRGWRRIGYVHDLFLFRELRGRAV